MSWIVTANSIEVTAATLTGVVADASSTPIPGAVVSVYSDSALTSPLGSGTTASDGSYSVAVNLIFFPTTVFAACVKVGVSFSPVSVGVSFSTTSATQDFIGTVLYEVSGTVVSTATPPVLLQGVIVFGLTTMTTDVNGAWSEYVPPGTYGYYAQIEGNVSTTSNETVTAAPISGVTLAIAAGTPYAGRVVDVNGVGFAGATVFITYSGLLGGWSGLITVVTTDAAGYYTWYAQDSVTPAYNAYAHASFPRYLLNNEVVFVSTTFSIPTIIIVTGRAITGNAVWRSTMLPAQGLSIPDVYWNGSSFVHGLSDIFGYFGFIGSDAALTVTIGNQNIGVFGSVDIPAGTSDVTGLIVLVDAPYVAPAQISCVDGSGAGIPYVQVAPGVTTDYSGNAQVTPTYPDNSVLVAPVLTGWTFAPTSATVASGAYQQFIGTRVGSTYALSGTVSGDVLAGVTITITGALGTAYTVYTGADGKWSQAGLANDTYAIAASLSGYTFTGPLTGVVVSGADVGGQNFTATKVAPSSFSLSGAISGDVTVGVEVALTGTSYYAYSDSSGNWSIALLPPGTYYPVASMPGYTVSTVLAQTIVAASLTGINFTTAAVATLYKVTGTTLLASDSSALAGVTFLVNGMPFTSDAFGDYAVTGLVAGSQVTLAPYLAGYQFTPSSVALQVWSADLTQNFTAVPSLSISGQVVVEGTRTGLAGVTLSCNGIPGVTNSSGNFVFTGLSANTTYVLTAVLDGYTFDTPLTEALVTSNVLNAIITATPAKDTTAPVVSILTPASGDTLTGDTVITWAATDNVAVTVCRVLIDGNVQATVDAGLAYSWTWLLSGWANGSHVIRVEADDAADNTGVAEITVTVARSLASGTKYWFSEQLAVPGCPNAADFSGKAIDLMLSTFAAQTLPDDPAERYNATVGIHIPGNPNFGDASPPALFAAFSTFQTITPNSSAAPLVPGSSWRLGICGQPAVVQTYWQDTAHTAATKFIPLPSGDLAVLASPAALLLLTLSKGTPTLSVLESIVAPPPPGAGGDVISFEALWRESTSGDATPVTPTITDACYYSGHILLAAQAHLVCKNLTTGDLTDAVTLPGWVSVDAVMADTTGPAYLATWDGTTARLYSFDLLNLVKVTDLPGRVKTMIPWGTGTLMVGGQDGVITVAMNGNVTTVYDTTQAHVNRLVADGQVLWALTGDAGKLYRSQPAWALDNTFALTELYGAAVYQNALYLGGNGAALWRLIDATWTEWATLAGVTAINDVWVPADGSALYLAVTQTASGDLAAGATIYRIEFATPGGFVCGPTLPAFWAGAPREG